MALKDLIATPGEAAANKLLAGMRFASAAIREELWAGIRNAVDSAVSAERERCCQIIYGQCGSDNVAERTVRAIRKNA